MNECVDVEQFEGRLITKQISHLFTSSSLDLLFSVYQGKSKTTSKIIIYSRKYTNKVIKYSRKNLIFTIKEPTPQKAYWIVYDHGSKLKIIFIQLKNVHHQ
ncbi:hypothetical protein PPL_06541 [Heterostelium album PN500]|uniref:Uncharacterized protein n=1 Tax=Heterostelium pallidum (strain ATCC 26659 / Pp 5 / PN500) TaxID=670386 RepID=D3BDF8_HETP5|nr:hypothetical protein PPL_06541 [Heterostelium album PN500]EFA80602.1 hypothetical protein PPL_06541 [Heterostelium album PN500]|eukprot:XP_020432722.1 hypothetical protein PPL_06541 [Heterostelium album PN500]